MQRLLRLTHRCAAAALRIAEHRRHNAAVQCRIEFPNRVSLSQTSFGTLYLGSRTSGTPLYAHTAVGLPERNTQHATVTAPQHELNIPFVDCCFYDRSTSAQSMHCRSLCRTQMSAVPDHLLEVVFGQLPVSDCAACCCVSQELKALAQVHCRLC